MAEESTAG